MKDISLNIGFW